MSNLQVKNVPESLHRKLREIAARERISLRTLVLDAVERRVALEEFRRRLRGRAPVELPHPAGESLEAVRAERDVEGGGE